MSIRTKARIIFAISIGLVAVISFLVFYATQNLKEQIEKNRIAEEIHRGALDLSILTNDYLRQPEEQARIQWQSQYDSLKALLGLDVLMIFEDERRTSFYDLRTHCENMKATFNKLVAEYEQRPLNNEEENIASEKLEEQLADRLLIYSQTIVSGAGEITKEIREKVLKIQSQTTIFIVSCLGAIILSMILVLFWIARDIIKPIESIQKGAKVIGGGNFNHRLEIKTGDELEQLSNEFNRMSEEIKKSYRGLEQKVEERTYELEIAKNRSETLLASIGDAVFAIDRESNIIHFNPQAEELSGYKSSEVLGKPYYDFLQFIKEKDKSENLAFIRKALKGETAEILDKTVIVRKDKRELPVADRAAPIKDKDGKIIGVIVVFRDATQEREIERMRTELISLTGHQLKTPLTSIKGFIEMLKETKLSSEAKEHVAEIERGAKAMSELVGDVLNVSRIEQGRIEIKLDPTRLEEIIDNLIKDLSPVAKKRKVSIEFKKPSEPLPEVNVDLKYIREAIQNIISNAINYTKDKVVISLEKIDNNLRFSCVDNGIGIPRNEQSQIFTKFFRASNTTKTGREGTGLGLSIAKAIIEQHKGKVWFESEENKGTTFYITLPFI